MLKEPIFVFINRLRYRSKYSLFTKIPGIPRLYYFIHNNFKPELIQIRVHNNKMIVKTKDIGLTPSLMYNGIYEEYETEILKKIIKSNTTFIDIGANIGYFTLIAANLIKDGKVYSFEPEPNNFKLLVKNVDINNLKNVFTIQTAVSNEIGKKNFFIDKINFGNHSIAKNNVEYNDNFIEVNTITLDHFFKDANNLSDIIIKIDTQGAEGLIIEGAERLLKNNKIKILMEFWPIGLKNVGTDPLKLINKLKSFDFKINVISNVNRSLDPITSFEIQKICENAGEFDQINLFLEKIQE